MKNVSIEHRPLIAIIDDDPTQARLISMILEADFDTCIANTGQQAIDMVKARNPDLVLLDIVMPEVDGYEVNALLKKNPYTFDIPVIFITNLQDADNETTALISGAADFVTKPVNPSVLKARVTRVLELTTYMNFLMRLIEEKDVKIDQLRTQASELLEKTPSRIVPRPPPTS